MEFEIRSLLDDQVEQMLLGVHAKRCELDALELTLIGELAARGVHRGDGHCSMGEWLVMKLHIGIDTARRMATLADRFRQLPELHEALRSATVTFDQAYQFARFSDADTIAGDIAWYADRPVSDLELLARKKRTVVERDERPRLWLRKTTEGGRFSGEVFGDDWDTLLSALERQATTHFNERKGAVDTTHLSVGERHGEALMSLARQRIVADGDPDRADIVVHTSVGDLERVLAGATGNETGVGLDVVETGLGTVLAPRTLGRLLCDCRLQAIADAVGTAMGLTSPERTAPPQVVRALRQRDRCCRFPGCAGRQFLRAHHLWWARHGGPTAWKNLVLICPFHHRLVHEGGWTLTGDPDATLTFTRPDGTVSYTSTPPPARAA